MGRISFMIGSVGTGLRCRRLIAASKVGEGGAQEAVASFDPRKFGP